MNILQFIEKTADNEQSIVNLSVGDHIEIIAKPGESYNLIAPETGLTANDIGAERFGDDLLLFNEENDIRVLIRDFWNGQCVPGETQCFAVLDVPGMDGRLGQVTITQQGQILDHLLAGEMGTLGDGEALCAYITATSTGLFAGIHPGIWIAGFAAVMTGIAVASSHDNDAGAAADSSTASSAESETTGSARSAADQVNPKGSTIGLDSDGRSEIAIADDKGSNILTAGSTPEADGTDRVTATDTTGNISVSANTHDAGAADFNILRLQDGDSIINFDNLHKISAVDMATDTAANELTVSDNDVLSTVPINHSGIRELFISGGDNDVLNLHGDYQKQDGLTDIGGDKYQCYHSIDTNTDIWVEENLIPHTNIF